MAGLVYLDAFGDFQAVPREQLKALIEREGSPSFGAPERRATFDEMLRPRAQPATRENLAQSREMGLVLNVDNVRKNARFLCHCCKCCCLPLLDIRKHGYPNSIVTSNYVARISDDSCNACGKCVKACPIDAIAMTSDGDGAAKKNI